MSYEIAVLGDIHTAFDKEDVSRFNGSDYDLILFVGDLPGRSHRQTLTMATIMSHLKKPAIAMAGNHDATSVKHLIGELTGDPFLKQSSASGQLKRVQELREALGPVRLAAYESIPLHQFANCPWPMNVIAARPHSMGGPGLAFEAYLAHAFEVRTIEESARKIVNIADTPVPDLLFLAHNGPSGLGNRRNDMFGVDFSKSEGDNGDPDLEMAISELQQKKHTIRAVLAGHMHHSLRGGGHRKWLMKRDQITYINAARVPRMKREGSRTLRHHVRLSMDPTDLTVEEVFWE